MKVNAMTSFLARPTAVTWYPQLPDPEIPPAERASDNGSATTTRDIAACTRDRLEHSSSERPPTVAAIVCAFNEARRIGKVLRIIASYPGFHEVIVVDDGSTDRLDRIVRLFRDVRFIRQDVNRGKGHAMATAARAT